MSIVPYNPKQNKKPAKKAVVVKTTTTTKQVPKTKSQKPKVTTVVKPSTDRLVYNPPHCTTNYLKALVDPFSEDNSICIPTGEFPFDSQKVKLWQRGSFHCGTSGVGFIAVNPPKANNSNGIKYTTPTSVGTASTLFSAFTNVGDSSLLGCPYSSTDLTTGQVYGRVVAAGIRIQYRGKLMDQNGITVSFEHRDHANSLPLFSFDALGGQQTAKTTVVTRNQSEWVASVCYSGPAFPGNVDFNQDLGLSISGNFMLIAVSGIPGDQFQYEYCTHLEYLGSKAAAMTTESHSDAQGMGSVLKAVKGVTRDKPLAPSDKKTVWESFKESVSETLPKIMSTVLGGPFKLLPTIVNSIAGAEARGRESKDLVADSMRIHRLQMLLPDTSVENQNPMERRSWTIPEVGRVPSLKEIIEDEQSMMIIIAAFLEMKKRSDNSDREFRRNSLPIL